MARPLLRARGVAAEWWSLGGMGVPGSDTPPLACARIRPGLSCLWGSRLTVLAPYAFSTGEAKQEAAKNVCS